MFLLTGGALSPTSLDGHLESVTIDPDSSNAADERVRWKFDVQDSEERLCTLELGDSLENAIVELTPCSRLPSHPRVQVQFETSVTIMNQGPHLDLLDWKHHTSNWRDTISLGDCRFQLPKFGEDERLLFPKVGEQEFREAVLAAGGTVWASLLRSHAQPHDPPATVDISTIRVRILVQSGAEWKETFRLVFKVPMGC